MLISRSALQGSLLFSFVSAESLIERRGAVAIDGRIITSCASRGVIALTFDDGPHIYTKEILSALDKAGHKATFFQNGKNYGSIYDHNSTIKTMVASGHQIASHTWSHKDLTKLTAQEIVNEMMTLEDAHKKILGYAPTYMRPPFLSVNPLAISILKQLEYKIISVDIDTQDWENDSTGKFINNINWFKGNLTGGGTISLKHDPFLPTAKVIVPAIIEYLASKNLKSVTIGQCLGDDPKNWYRRSTPSYTPPASSSATQGSTNGPTASTINDQNYQTPVKACPILKKVVTNDGKCGRLNGKVCPEGLCCSSYGWCGKSPDFCGFGCQSVYGICT